MKRLNNLYDKMISYSNANYVFNRIKNNCHNKKRVFAFLKYKNSNIVDILFKLKNQDYTFSNFGIFLINEKKYRIIMSENINDKIVNQMISYFILLPSFKNLIDTNIATRKNKGTSYGYKKINEYLKSIGTDKEIYVLKIDIKKYFYNIDHKILYSMLEKRIKDKKALKIIKEMISLTNYNYVNNDIDRLINEEINRISKLNLNPNELEKKIIELNNIPRYQKDKGLSIGCLSNQLFAIFYLSEFDHYVKEVLKYKYYIRYMDDIYFFDTNKEKLENSFNLITNKLKELKLEVNNKSGIYRMQEGISFLGYTYYIKNSKIIIKYTNSTIRKIDRKLNKLYNSNFEYYYRSIRSYNGYFIRSNTKLYNNKYYNKRLVSKKDKYSFIKEKYNDSIVFIKYKNKYYTYNNDLMYVKTYIKKRYNSITEKEFNKFIRKEKNYVVLEGNKIILS